MTASGIVLMLVTAAILVAALLGGWATGGLEIVLAVIAVVGSWLFGWGIARYAYERTTR